MQVVLVNGEPAAGKTTLAKRLARESGMTLICKDDIKDFLFDTIGASDREWSMAVGKAAADFQWQLAEVLLAAGKSVMLENAYYAEFARKHLKDLLEKHKGVSVLEIYCQANPDVQSQRFAERAASGERHSGHVDTEYTASPATAKRYAPITGEDAIAINTTDPSLINYDKLLGLLQI